MAHKKEDLEAIRDLLAEGTYFDSEVSTPFSANNSSIGKIKPLVDSVFEFGDALKAYDRLLTSRAKGKVVVKVDASLT